MYDLEHTGCGHTPLFSVACAHFGNGKIRDPKYTTKVFSREHTVYMCTVRTTNGLMEKTNVSFQSTRMTKSFIAHITFIRFLVRVNTHVYGQT